jgi:sortase A
VLSDVPLRSATDSGTDTEMLPVGPAPALAAPSPAVAQPSEPAEPSEPLAPSTPSKPRPVRRKPRPLGTVAAVALWSSGAVSLLCLWLVLSAVVLGPVQERAEQGRLYDAMREQLANGTAPLGPTDVGAPVALLHSPRGGLNDVVVVEGTSSGQTQRGPGHRRNTVLPGQQGVSVLFGRGAAYGASFGGITRLRAGDRITATTGQGVFVYVVDGVRRRGDPLPLPLDATGGRLTLATLEGATWRNGFTAHDVVYVDATMQGKAQLPDAAHPATVPKSEDLMMGDSGAILLLLIWVQALFVAGCALGWAQTRWGRWQSWLVGAPVLLAILWSASTAAAQLLPNLL